MLENLLISKPLKAKRDHKAWISKKEIHRFIDLVLWATNTQSLQRPYHVFGDRIKSLWDNSGSTFTFKYLKEVLRIVVRMFAGLNVEPSKSIFVKLDAKGYPAIIPLEIVETFHFGGSKFSKESMVSALSVISIFRVLPTKVMPSLSTITDPFKGLSRNIDSGSLERAITLLGVNLRIKSTVLLGSVKSGPNSRKAFLGTCLDAFALVTEPRVLFGFLAYPSPLWLKVWWLAIVVLTTPILLLSFIVGAGLPLNGRLSVVTDQAGKARIVAITNWWIQTSLYPLHNSIMSYLRTLPTDGTFDQIKPFKALIQSYDRTHNLSGFDLSAATDRLPIDVQAQILDLSGINGRHWKRILSLHWFFKHKDLSQRVYYAVGQPMGAYSSWGMLALTHHVLVQVAAERAGITERFDSYCILGDDVVIAHNLVAKEYVSLMNNLGVDISLGKSVISDRFTEFAKKLMGPDEINISPLGPGLILRTIRYRYYIIRLVVDMLDIGLVSMTTVWTRLQSLPPRMRKYEGCLKWSLCIKYLSQFSSLDHRKMNGDYWKVSSFNVPIQQLFLTLCEEVGESRLRDIKKLINSIKHTLVEGLWETHSRADLPSLREFAIFPLMPGVYFLIGSYWRSFDTLVMKMAQGSIISENIYSAFNENWFDTFKKLLNLIDCVDISSLDFTDKEAIKNNMTLLKKINKAGDGNHNIVLDNKGLRVQFKLPKHIKDMSYLKDIKGFVPLDINFQGLAKASSHLKLSTYRDTIRTPHSSEATKTKM